MSFALHTLTPRTLSADEIEAHERKWREVDAGLRRLYAQRLREREAYRAALLAGESTAAYRKARRETGAV